MKRPDVYISARADVAVIRLGVERARAPRVEVELDPSAARELIRELERAVKVATGTDVTMTTSSSPCPRSRERGERDLCRDDGAGACGACGRELGVPIAWSESVGYMLSAFAPAGTVR